MRFLCAALIPVLVGCSSGTFEKAGPFGSGTPNASEQGDTDDTDGDASGGDWTGSTGGGEGSGGSGSSSTTGEPVSTTGDECPVGTEGCPCEEPLQCTGLLACDDGICVDPGNLPTGSTGEVEELPCDAGFEFSPAAPSANAPFSVRFTDPDPLVYIGLVGGGDGPVDPEFDGIPEEDPWTWEFSVSELAAGEYHFAFTRDMGVEHATCRILLE